MCLLEAIQFALMVLPHPKFMDRPFPVPRGITAAGGQGLMFNFLQDSEHLYLSERVLKSKYGLSCLEQSISLL